MKDCRKITPKLLLPSIIKGYFSILKKRPCLRTTVLFFRAKDSLGFDDGDDLAVLDEFHLAVLKGEKREITPLTDILAGVELGAALADDDRAGLEKLAVVSLDAKILGVGIATVAG